MTVASAPVSSGAVGTYLDRILVAHRERAAADERSFKDLIEQAGAEPPARPFAAALAGDPDLSVIAEIKRRSPSKGDLDPHLDPARLAHAYVAGGAIALSVLTDHEFFGGSPADLSTARAACELPVLRKDFTVDARDVCDARLMGADCVLLIAAALTDDELSTYLETASQVGIDALVETHADEELDRALAAGATLVGVNQRDLHTFTVDPERAVRLAERIPAGVVKVAESGVRGAEDALRLRRAGYDAVLVGESLVTAADPAAVLHAIRTAL